MQIPSTISYNTRMPSIEVDLLKLSQHDRNVFKQQVENNSGLLTVLFHPFPDQHPTFPVTPEYLERRNDLIREAFIKNKPLVIFEGVNKYPHLANRVKEITGPTGGVFYTVQTISDDPTPLLPYINIDSPVVHITPGLDWMAWRRVAGVLRQANVSTIEVGGRYMVLKDTNGNPDDFDVRTLRNIWRWSRHLLNARQLANSGLVPDACAGRGMLEFLRCGFDVIVSGASAPSSGLVPTDLSGVRLKGSDGVY